MSDHRRSSNMPTMFESLHSGSPDDVRKRVSKACDRCRLKKIKCDGKVPCSRCQSDSTICRYGERKKSIERRIPPGYVDYLEEQQKVLVQALRKAWGEINPPTSGVSTPNEPSVNEILASLGVLDEFTRDQPGRENFAFEEDLDAIRRRLEEEDDAAITSASSARSSPGRSSIAAPAEPFRDPFTNQGTLSLPAQFRFPGTETRTQTFPPANWQGNPAQLMQSRSESLSAQQQQQQQIFGQNYPGFQSMPSGGPQQQQQSQQQQQPQMPGPREEMEWAPEAQAAAGSGFQSPDRRAMSPMSAFGGFQQFPMSPGAFSSYRPSPQPQQGPSSQGGNTPGASWLLPEDDDAWRNWVNDRRDSTVSNLVVVG